MKASIISLALTLLSALACVAEAPGDAVVARLDRIVIPIIEFHDISVEEAVDFMRLRGAELDPEPEPAKKGFNILINHPERKERVEPTELVGGANEKSIRINYSVKSVRFTVALTEIARRAQLDLYITSLGIELCPRGQAPFPRADGEKSEIWKALYKADAKPDHFSNGEPGGVAGKDKPAAKPAWQALFDGKTLKGWKPADFGAKASIAVTDGELRIGPGEPAAGIVRDGEVPARMNYEIELEAMRTEGHDFFCGLTFPVNQDPCTLICGGWGGTLVGLSSIDDLDASENQTATLKEFKEKTWYKIRLRVTTTHITAWINDEQLIEQELAEHKISIRTEVEPCVPLGISTWHTGAALRNIRLRKLD